MKKAISFIALVGLLVGLVGGAKAAGPVTVWEDVAGDADAGQGLGSSIPAGFDLTAGSIVKKGANLEFTVTHNDMPPTGTFPEGFRFLWAFSVNGKSNYRLTVKSADIGKPDVAAGQTTERVGRADVAGHFRLEGECIQDSSLPVGMVNCPVVGYLDGTWDAASKSFTVVIPLKTIKAKKGSIIGAGGGSNAGICSICWVTHYAERSLNATLIDTAGMTGTYKVK
jgi:hypothetical protein